jgi:GT2 family glycosyltransferase
VVIVNYRQWPQTYALVRQLSATPETRRGVVEVVIVDNHSPPHPVIRRLRHRHGVSLRRWKHNRGFARAVNEGVRLGRGEWILVLNADVALDEGYLAVALRQAQSIVSADPCAGIVGFRLLHEDGSPQLSSGQFPTLWTTLAGILVPRAKRKYSSVPIEAHCQVPWVTGCCMLLRRACLEELGGFDPEFFLYYEDVDLCHRARAAGWSVWYEPAARAVHYRPLHRRTVSTALRVCTRHALLTYAAKQWPRWHFMLIAGIVRIEAWFRQAWADCQGDERAVMHFGELGGICIAMLARRHNVARRRLERVVRHEDLHAA